METLFSLLHQFLPLSDALKADLAQRLHRRSYPRGSVLLDFNEVCSHLFFMEKGFAKGMYMLNKKEITSWFWKEMDIVTSMQSFLQQIPSIERISTTEPCDMILMCYEDLQFLYTKHVEFNIVGRKIIEQYFLEANLAAVRLRNLTAKEKYDNLLNEYPQILQRTSLDSIASYLGITKETLSRIRGK
ncbi:MAG: Crp/Fnr family transcriptional regulator [Bacteroidota bacterium]